MNALSLFSPSFASNVLDAFDRDFGFVAPLPATTTAPRVDVKETKTAYVMEMDLPGMTEKDVEINLKDRVLSISSLEEANKEERKTEDGVEYLIRERRSTCFSRRFSLPEDIDAEKVEADFKNGVLTVNIPRKPESQPRQIQIRSA